jgi:hypothetical protein
MTSSLPERTVESWLAMELEVWFRNVRLWAPTQNAIGNWDVAAQGAGKLLIFECKGCNPLKQGHTVPINMPQLYRYAKGPEFAAVRDHVFYVLPAPPWSGPALAPGTPFTPAEALPAVHADQRLVSQAGGCWEWFHVISARSLWASLTTPSQSVPVTGSRSVNTRRLPSPRIRCLKAHPLRPLPETKRLGDFLEGIAKCDILPLTGEDTVKSSARRSHGQDRNGTWHRPDGRVSNGPEVWPEHVEPPEPPEQPEVPRDQTAKDEHSKRSTPRPLAAFLPRSSLAVP